MKIVVSGASGLIGQALVPRLREAGHDVIQLVRRSPANSDQVAWDPDGGRLDPAVIDGAGAVINLSGAGIGDKRWTAAYKRELLDSRVGPTSLLARTIAQVDRPPVVMLSASAIGYYGPTGDEQLTEQSPAGSTFLADICVRWEAATAAADAATRVVHLRTGIVLSRHGGALRKQLPLFKLGLGGPFGRGRPWQSWITVDDHVSATIHLLDSSLTGPVNLTAPNPVTGKDFARTLGSVLRRPAFIPIPAFGPKLLLGGELADALLFTGQRVLPAALNGDGFTFAQPQLDGALRHVLGR